MKKYMIRLGNYDAAAKIMEVEVERETTACVFVNGRKRSKRSEFENYFDAWREAKIALVEHQEARVQVLKRQLEIARSKLGSIQAMN